MGGEQSRAQPVPDAGKDQFLDAPPSAVVTKRIASQQEFENQLLPSDTFLEVVSGKVVAAWANGAFKHREWVYENSDGGSTRTGTSFGRQATGDTTASAYSIDSKVSVEGEIFKLKDGRIYQGEWMNGLMHGKGTLFGPNAMRYDGSFKCGKKHGEGTLKYEDGRIYRGQFADGKPHGKGEMTGTFGEKYRCKANCGKIQTM